MLKIEKKNRQHDKKGDDKFAETQNYACRNEAKQQMSRREIQSDKVLTELHDNVGHVHGTLSRRMMGTEKKFEEQIKVFAYNIIPTNGYKYVCLHMSTAHDICIKNAKSKKKRLKI